jgi:hypothetical protein
MAETLPSLERASGWVGLRLDGLDQKTLGRVAGLLVDAEDGDPRWVVVRLGPLAGSTGIPFDHVAEGAGRLWAAYDREMVKEALRFNPDEALTAEQELELCAAWGLSERQGRRAELVGRGDDEVTAVPQHETGGR